jgi:hypothetical protein
MIICGVRDMAMATCGNSSMVISIIESILNNFTLQGFYVLSTDEHCWPKNILTILLLLKGF